MKKITMLSAIIAFGLALALLMKRAGSKAGTGVGANRHRR